jgi:hypothetical protein
MRWLALGALLLCALATPASAQPTPAERIRRDVQALVSPELEGRGYEAEGHLKARDLVIERMTELGLIPAGDDGGWLVSSPAIAHAAPGRDVALKVAGRVLAPGAQFMPLGCSGGGAFAGQLVFVGYGLSTAERDDWAEVDVAGKVALVWEGAPRELERAFMGADAHMITSEGKAALALAHGAAAVLIMTREEAPTSPSLMFALGGMPAALVTSAAMAEELALLGPLDVPRALGVAVSGELGVSRREVTVYNVVGRLKGSPAIGQPLVLGAHYDHLGMGARGSLDDAGELHPGADDNASGVAAMFEVARRLGEREVAWRQPVYFVAFGGEEIGLRGARRQAARWRGEPGMLINLDMVGRLRDGRLYAEAHAASTHLLLRDVLRLAAPLGLRVEEDARAHISDAVAFADVGFETLHLTTGRHADYHTPDDDLERVNVAGIAQIVELLVAILSGLG